MQAIADVALRLRKVHGSGYAHRALKPANVMWLPPLGHWTPVDGGSAARIGETVPLVFTLAYAPPEAVQAWVAARSHALVSAACDAWALGVIAFELLTGRPALDVFMAGRDEVRHTHSAPVHAVQNPNPHGHSCTHHMAPALSAPARCSLQHSTRHDRLYSCCAADTGCRITRAADACAIPPDRAAINQS